MLLYRFNKIDYLYQKLRAKQHNHLMSTFSFLMSCMQAVTQLWKMGLGYLNAMAVKSCARNVGILMGKNKYYLCSLFCLFVFFSCNFQFSHRLVGNKSHP